MKKFTAILLVLCLALPLAACGKKDKAAEVVLTQIPVTAAPVISTPKPTPSPEPTPSPTPVPIQPELPEVVDESLNAVLDMITDNVRPGSSGTSLRAAACAAALLDWGMNTPLSDDEIYSAVGCWLDTLDDARLVQYFDSFYPVYSASYDLKGDNAENLLRDAGVGYSAYPWNEQAFHAVEMVSYGCGLR